MGPVTRGTIVCAVGSADDAGRPVLVAGELARRLDDGLVLVHAVTAPPPALARGAGMRPVAVSPPDHERLERAAEAVLLEAQQRCGDTPVLRRPLVGDPAAAVVDAAADADANLIVVGSGRRGLFAGALLGSVSRGIADATETPVVVVPVEGELRPLAPVKRIVCGVADGEESRRAARVGRELAARFDAKLVLAGAAASAALPGASAAPGDVWELLRAEEERVRLPPPLRRGRGPAGRHRVPRARAGSPAVALEEVASEEDAALIVVGRRGGLFRDLVRGSVSADLQTRARRPVVLA